MAIDMETMQMHIGIMQARNGKVWEQSSGNENNMYFHI
jgi:hypothetical protein